jgi:hypothetical protein
LKLTLTGAKPITGSVKNPLTKPGLSVKFEAPFTKQHAKTLDCQELFDGDGGLRRFEAAAEEGEEFTAGDQPNP